jgi:hypothetical protein
VQATIYRKDEVEARSKSQGRVVADQEESTAARPIISTFFFFFFFVFFFRLSISVYQIDTEPLL